MTQIGDWTRFMPSWVWKWVIAIKKGNWLSWVAGGNLEKRSFSKWILVLASSSKMCWYVLSLFRKVVLLWMWKYLPYSGSQVKRSKDRNGNAKLVMGTRETAGAQRMAKGRSGLKQAGLASNRQDIPSNAEQRLEAQTAMEKRKNENEVWAEGSKQE